LAGREALSNLIGTIVILLDRPFKIGDYVLIGDKVQGTVLNIGLRSTRIYTLNGLFVSIPNATVAKMEIINESAPSSETQISIPVGVAYGSDVSDVEETLMAVAQGNEFVVPGRGTSVRFVAFGDSSLQFELLVWIVRPDIKRTAVSQINQAIYREFQKKGIEMPFPQRDIHIRPDK
jgi:MscS family membrane protein